MKFLWDHKWILLLVMALLLAMTLTVVSLLNPGHDVGVSSLLSSVMRPLQTAVGTFGDWMSSLWGNQDLIDELIAENQRLRKYIAEVDEQARLYEQTLKENELFREVLGFSQRRRELTLEPVTVVARDLDNYARVLSLSKGSSHGVEPGMIAVNENGQLVGVISEVSVSGSTLLTVADSSFVCGAYIYRPSLDGVCQGRFEYMRNNLTTMTGLTPDMDVRVGDMVLTSGIGDLYPRDLEIGTVTEVLFDPNGMTATAILSPMADLRHIEQVFLVLSFDNQE